MKSASDNPMGIRFWHTGLDFFREIDPDGRWEDGKIVEDIN